MTSYDEISGWYDAGVKDNMAYMLVFCDTFDWSDFPVYAEDAAHALRILHDPTYGKGNMQELMECFDLSMDKDSQMNERRAMHLPKGK